MYETSAKRCKKKQPRNVRKKKRKRIKYAFLTNRKVITN